MKERSKEGIDRLFDNGFGIIRFKNFALIKAYSYKYMIKEFLWALVGIPVNLIIDIGKTLLYLLNFVPRIYIEIKIVKAKKGSDVSDNYGNFKTSMYCPNCSTYLGDFDTDEIVECPICKANVETY